MSDFSDRVQSGVQERPLRTVIYGSEGIGKSTFAAEFPKPFFISAEDGVSHIDTNSIVPKNWRDLIAIMSALNDEDGKPYDTINIDTIGWVAELCAKYVCERNNVSSLEDIGYGKWRRMLFDEFQNFLRWCTALYNSGKHVNLIAHAQVTTFKNPEGEDFDRYNIQVSWRDIAEVCKQWADVVAFMNFDTTVVEPDNKMKAAKAKSTGAHQMFLTRSAAFDAKNRWNMPAMLDMGNTPESGFNKFWNEYQAGLKRTSSKKATKTKPAKTTTKTTKPPAAPTAASAPTPPQPPAAPAATTA